MILGEYGGVVGTPVFGNCVETLPGYIKHTPKCERVDDVNIQSGRHRSVRNRS